MYLDILKMWSETWWLTSSEAPYFENAHTFAALP
jgi:hypothetical protein